LAASQRERLNIAQCPEPISSSATSKASSTCSASSKCDRKGRYHVHKLIEKYGRNGNMMKWREKMLNADCPKRLQDRCDLVCPDLPKVL
jgi:hypothetical protein